MDPNLSYSNFEEKELKKKEQERRYIDKNKNSYHSWVPAMFQVILNPKEGRVKICACLVFWLKYTLAFLGPFSRWDFQSGNHLGA